MGDDWSWSLSRYQYSIAFVLATKSLSDDKKLVLKHTRNGGKRHKINSRLVAICIWSGLFIMSSDTHAGNDVWVESCDAE